MNASEAPRQLVIGLDSLEWDLVVKWAAAGKLPAFRRLMEDGTQAELSSVSDRLPDAAWKAGRYREVGNVFPWSSVYSLRFGTIQFRGQDTRSGSHTAHGFLLASGEGVPRATQSRQHRSSTSYRRLWILPAWAHLQDVKSARCFAIEKHSTSIPKD
jgi:hypothetical protein